MGRLVPTPMTFSDRRLAVHCKGPGGLMQKERAQGRFHAGRTAWGMGMLD